MRQGAVRGRRCGGRRGAGGGGQCGAEGGLSWRRALDRCRFSTRNQVSDAFRQAFVNSIFFSF